MPSAWEEPYGNVVLEAMACGCVPIASNGGGLPEAVGEAGLLFKRNDLNDMVNVLKDALGNPEKIELLRNKAQEHLEQHTLELAAERYFKIIQRAAK